MITKEELAEAKRQMAELIDQNKVVKPIQVPTIETTRPSRKVKEVNKHIGVYLIKRAAGPAWRVTITRDGKSKQVGTFHNHDKACQAAKEYDEIHPIVSRKSELFRNKYSRIRNARLSVAEVLKADNGTYYVQIRLQNGEWKKSFFKWHSEAASFRSQQLINIANGHDRNKYGDKDWIRYVD